MHLFCLVFLGMGVVEKIKTTKHNEHFEIRDLRDGKFLWIAKSALEFISEKTGSLGVAVYCWLCYYANSKAQDCFPSTTTLASRCDLSKRTIMRVLKELEIIRAIVIEREIGKSNVYKLLDIQGKHPVITSAVSVTGDANNTGVVTETTPLPVTVDAPEQELYKQESINKSASCLFDSWKDVKLPYPMPTAQIVEELDALCQQLLNEVNLYRFILDFRTERGYPPPPDALITACRQFERYKDRIDNPWGWFRKMIDVKSREFFSDEEVVRHEKLKKQPATVGKILSQMVKDV